MKTFQAGLIKGFIFFLLGLCGPTLTAQTYPPLISYSFHELRVKILNNASKDMAKKINAYLNKIEREIFEKVLANSPNTIGDISLRDTSFQSKWFIRKGQDIDLEFSVEEVGVENTFQGNQWVRSYEKWGDTLVKVLTNTYEQQLTGKPGVIKASCEIESRGRKKTKTSFEFSVVVGSGLIIDY